MADFKTHMIGAAAVSGIAATGLLLIGIAGNGAVAAYFVLGVVGGLLPDLDSDTSIPVRVAFTVLAIWTCFLLVFHLGHRYSLIELVALWAACYLAVRYGVFTLFAQITAHRGLFHSLPAAAAAALVTVLIAHRIFGQSAVEAWLCGAFVALGFLVHLLLDEIYSVDLMGAQLKRSFGTALNLGSASNPYGTAALYGVVAGLFYLSPPPGDFLAVMLSRDTYLGITERLFPAGSWFQGLFDVMAAWVGELTGFLRQTS
jgi:hypothetical protein